MPAGWDCTSPIHRRTVLSLALALPFEGALSLRRAILCELCILAYMPRAGLGAWHQRVGALPHVEIIQLRLPWHAGSTPRQLIALHGE